MTDCDWRQGPERAGVTAEHITPPISMTPQPTDATSPAATIRSMLEDLLKRTPGSLHALVLSTDGLKICHTSRLDNDLADSLAAIATGIQALSRATSVDFGTAIGAGQSMTEFPGGLLVIVPAGAGAHLAVLAHPEVTEVDLIFHNVHELVEQIGPYLTAPARQPDLSDRSS
jgi:predicted regulator of Ras-like GTPase activity (Roadblock/LC7/MglB family)